jgi:nicotinamide-nucleotide amidase
VKIKLVARGKNAAKEIASVEMEIRGRIGDYIFAENDITMETKIGELLTKKGLKLSIAESCTGGLISNMITNVSGSSNYFERGIISYSNRSKIEILGVKEELIEKYGAVSKECAVKMAEGVRQISGSDIGLAVTGIAGPSGGTAQKPVGTVHIAISTKDGNLHKHLCQPRERTAFKIVVAYQALDMVRRYLIRSW